MLGAGEQLTLFSSVRVAMLLWRADCLVTMKIEKKGRKKLTGPVVLDQMDERHQAALDDAIISLIASDMDME